MPNRILLVVHYLACFKAGLVATPLNYRYAPPEIDHALEVSGASALVAHAERADDLAATRARGAPARRRRHLREAARRRPAPTLEGADGDRPPDRSSSRPTDADAPGGDLLHVRQHRARPRASRTASRRSAGWPRARPTAFELTAADSVPPRRRRCRTSARSSGRWPRSRSARTSWSRARFDAGEILPLLRAHRPTVLAMIPAALTALVRDHDVHRRRLRVAAPLPLRRRQGVARARARVLRSSSGFLIDEGYGMTEVGLATLNPPSGAIKQGSIGRPVAGRRASASRDDDDGEVAVGDGRAGCGSGPGARPSATGRNPDATARDHARRLARLRRPRARRRRRLPLVLRPQEADHRARRLEHQPVRGRGRAGRAPGGRARRRGRHPRRGARRERARLRHGRRTASQRPTEPGAHRVRPRSASATRRPRRSSSSTRCRSTPPASSTASALKRLAEDHVHPHGLPA